MHFMLSVHGYLFLVLSLFYRFHLLLSVMKVFVAVLLVAMAAGKCAIFKCKVDYLIVFNTITKAKIKYYFYIF